MQQHDGYTGVWVRSEVAEVFVATEPKFRVLAFRELKSETLFADGRTNEQGLRLAFMEPEQIPQSFEVGNQPAKVIERNDRRVNVRLIEAAALRYDIAIAIDDREPRLNLTYTLTNVGASERRVACWSLVSYALDGTIVVPFGKDDRARRRLVLPWWTKWPQPNASIARSAMSVDVSKPIEGTAYKVGLITEPGWIAFARGQHALVSQIAFDADRTYPEGGANITFYIDRNRAETEQVGPLTQLAPGEWTQMRESLRMIRFTPEADDPDSMARSIAR
jgi:hypothetical protein